jgi:hypothetical protein
MFFDETFGGQGVPATIVKYLTANFPAQVGTGFSVLGMIPDPRSTDGLPLGLAYGAKLGGQVDSLVFTCASCHLAKLPDGRYAVGAPNHGYDYGRQILQVAVFPTVSIFGPSGHDPDAVAAVQPLLDAVSADASLKQKLSDAISPLISSGATAPPFSAENEHHYATWKTGTQDFLIQPIPIDDGVHTVSKISAIWEIPPPDELAMRKLPSAWLGFTGVADGLPTFLHGFAVVFGAGDQMKFDDAALAPLAEYVLTLRRPANPTPPDASAVARGRQLFTDRGCIQCHDGPRGMGDRLYDYSEIGTDPAMKDWGANLPSSFAPMLTHQLKSPRLAGEWTFTRFLHNGSVDSLAGLFCTPARGSITEPAFSDAGHTYGCTLPPDEKQSLIAYLSQ